GGTALVTAVIAGIASLAKGSYRGGATATAMLKGSAPSARATAPRPRQSAPVKHRRTSRPRHARPPRGAVRLGAASQLASGSAALYHDPGDGQPDIVVRQSDGSLDAFSAICTHAGCQVEYQSGAIVCPCHGSVFNPRTGSVEQGPAVSPLPRRRVLQQAGQLYALRT
ncbi:MAG: Rieske (2Fe-2S) protein, partial [Solirubrobacteraceae bacterium]